MLFYINKNTKIIVGRNNQPSTKILNIDFKTIGKVSFAFIDDKNKILPLNPEASYYFAGKKNALIFLSQTYAIENNILTFDINTYTTPFLEEITKRNTEIEVEIGVKTSATQNVLLRDYAFAQPRIYLEGLDPEDIILPKFYNKTEIDSLLNEKADKAETEAALALKANKDETEAALALKADKDETEAALALKADKDETEAALALKADKDELFSGSYTDLTNRPDIFEPNTTGDGTKFLSDNGEYIKVETDAKIIPSDPMFLYMKTLSYALQNGAQTWSGTLSKTPPTSWLRSEQWPDNEYQKEGCSSYHIFTWAIENGWQLLPTDNLEWTMYLYSDREFRWDTKIEIFIDDVLVRSGVLLDDDEGDDSRCDSDKTNIVIPVNTIENSEITTGTTLKMVATLTLTEEDPRGGYSPSQNTYGFCLRPALEIYGLAQNMNLNTMMMNPATGKALRTVRQNLENWVRNELENNSSGSSSEWFGDDGEMWKTLDGKNYCQEPGRTLYKLELEINQWDSNNSSIVFNTSSDQDFEFSVYIDGDFYINQEFNFEAGKTYIIAVDNYTILWSEVYLR